MAKINQNQEYYSLMNLNDTLSQALIKQGIPNGFHYLKDIASVKVSMFRYKNIEKIKNLTSEILETALLFGNFLCFYKSPTVGLGLFRYVVNGELNLYYKPKFVNILAISGEVIATNIPYDDIIPIRDNSMEIIPFLTMVEYIRKIDFVDTAIFKVLNIASLPLVISGSKKIATTAQSVAKKIGSPDAFIFGDDTLTDVVKAFDIDVKINPLDIYELKTKFKNECISSIGIYTIEQKKERKIVSEVSSQNEYTDFIYEDMREQRVSAFEKANKKWGLDIEVEEGKRIIAERHIKDTIEMTGMVNNDDSRNRKSDIN